MAVPLRLRKTNAQPLIGSCSSRCRHRAARPSMPRQKLAGSVATKIRIVGLVGITASPSTALGRVPEPVPSPAPSAKYAACGRWVFKFERAFGWTAAGIRHPCHARQRRQFDERRRRRLGLAAVYDSYPVLQSAEIHIQVGCHGLGAVRRRGLNGRHPQLMRDSPAAPADLPPPFKPAPGFRQAAHLRASPHRPSSSKVEVETNAFFPGAPKASCTLAATTPRKESPRSILGTSRRGLREDR